ncbi:DUF1203 domain-containing protein [Novosphingobium sp.]|uniref:DUF1203 domain-containing protein n=1 Tax=Novosphingobium sp. TaxID=1874826 RepID=UPI0025E9F832|nr:DUF1203 domain-containing protein [Novosphingobium sp.]MCC6924784.1 DUF1203 domain-containing protein [Novosphingobium sp.]
MTYRITGLAPDAFAALFDLSDAELASRNARRVVAQADRGFPCRISLEDARAGEELILLHHTSHDVVTPYRSAYAIYVRRDVTAADLIDATPQVFEGRPLGLRGFDQEGNLRDARLALPGEADSRIRDLFANPAIAYIHAHNAAHGCFAARIDRHGETA